MLDDGNYPMLTFVLEHETFSLGSLIDRQDIVDLLKGAFPKMEVSHSKAPPQGPLNQFQSTSSVSKTAIQDDITKRKREALVMVELLKNNTCKYFLANFYCPMMLFCEKEHITQDQLDARVNEHTFTKNTTSNELGTEETAKFVTLEETVVKSKQEFSYPILNRHVRHHSFSESSTAAHNLNLSPLAGILDFDRGRGNAGIRKSNSMEHIDKSHTGDTSNNLGTSYIGDCIFDQEYGISILINVKPTFLIKILYIF